MADFIITVAGVSLGIFFSTIFIDYYRRKKR